MPYIKQDQRLALLRHDKQEENPGELNFSLTKLCLKYANNHGSSYQTYNDVIGALECCKQEFYRVIITRYEKIKIEENGEI